jgi:hypothetical protein
MPEKSKSGPPPLGGWSAFWAASQVAQVAAPAAAEESRGSEFWAACESRKIFTRGYHFTGYMNGPLCSKRVRVVL